MSTQIEVLIDTGPTLLTKTWYVDGSASDVGTVTIGIVDADGTEVVAAGTAVTDNTDGTYEYSLAIQTEVADLSVTWTNNDGQALTDRVAVVGGWLFTIAELRAFHASDLTAAAYPNDDVGAMRTLITAEFERICGVAFVPTYKRQVLPGTGTRELEVDRPKLSSVLACTIGTATVTGFVVDELLPVVYRTGGVFNLATSTNPRNVTISYRHGHETVPPDIRRAAKIAAHSRLKKDVTGAGVPYSASSWNDGTGQYQTFAPNNKTQRWFGIPDVDSVLREYRLGGGVWA